MLQEVVGNFPGRGKGPTAVRDHGFICDGYSPAVLGKISPPDKEAREAVSRIHPEMDCWNDKRDEVENFGKH